MNQDKIFRAVAGAVRNTANAHPDWNIKPEYAPSIAKRAAGTLKALVPDVLAETPSDRDVVDTTATSAEAGLHTSAHSPGGGVEIVSTSRLVWFIERGYSPRRIAALTGAPMIKIAALKLGLHYRPGEKINFPSPACPPLKEDTSHGNPD